MLAVMKDGLDGKMTKRWTLGLLTLALFLLQASTGHAQGLNLDRYRAAETPEDGFTLSRPDDMGHLRVGAHLHLDYGYNPLVFEDELGNADTQVGAIVAHMLVANIAASLGIFDRATIFLGLPVNLVMQSEEGYSVLSGLRPEGSSVGDLYLGARVRIWGENDDIFAIGAQATLTFPTAHWADENAHYGGEQNFTGHLEALAEVRPGPVRITLNLGVRFRESADFSDDGSFVSGHDLTYALGVTYRPIELLEVLAELYGASTFQEFGNRENTPLELLAGVRFHPGMGFVVGLAGGTGLIRGVGSPAARAVLTFGWAMPPEPEPVDTDGDGLLDPDDDCPTEPEDVDEFEDEDGCPDPDNDQDGVLDVDDGCPMDPEDVDEFEDEDGCPDLDNDQDGHPRCATMQCPNEPEDVDEFEDEDGCPDEGPDQRPATACSGQADDDCPDGSRGHRPVRGRGRLPRPRQRPGHGARPG